MSTKIIETKSTANINQLMEGVIKWNKSLKVEKSADGESLIATARQLDLNAYKLNDLASVIGDDWTITLGRSGAHFKLIFW